MRELVERIEAADGPSRELDEAIRLLIEHNIVVALDLAGGYVGQSTPSFTASIDAALTLLPEGAQWGTGSRDGTLRSWAWCALNYEQPNERMELAFAATPALALVAAILRARGEG